MGLLLGWRDESEQFLPDAHADFRTRCARARGALRIAPPATFRAREAVDQLGGAVPLDTIRDRLRCSKCGLRPTSTEMTDDPAGMRGYQGLPQPRN